MSEADLLALLVLALCLLGSMFFSSAETAITSLGDRRARQIAAEGGREGEIMRRWVERPVLVLTTILLGNNLVNTLLGAVATALTLRHLQGGPYASWAVPLAVTVATVALLVFGETVPKAFGRLYARRIAVPALAVLQVLAKLTWPITRALAWFTEWVVRPNRDDGPDPELRVTAEELDFLVQQGQVEGSIPTERAEMLRSIVRFDERDVRDIMVPLDRVTWVDPAWDIDRIRAVAKASGHSRLPVFADTPDDVRGVLHIKQLLGVDEHGSDPNLIRSLLRPPMFVSESVRIGDLLRRFQEQRMHLAIVVDDAGHTVGVVTLEDVLEQIVGLIFDESDRAPAGPSLTERQGVYVFAGQDPLALVERKLGVELEDETGVDSIGDLLTRLAGDVPPAGSVFVWESLRVRVLAADARRIVRVSVERVIDDEADD